MRLLLPLIIGLVPLFACNDAAPPAGWSHADSLDLTGGGSCASSSLADNNDLAEAVSGSTLDVAFHHALGCDGEACGFRQVNGTTLQVLIQPCHFPGSAKADCLCLYDVSFETDIGAEVTTLEIYSRLASSDAAGLVTQQSIR